MSKMSKYESLYDCDHVGWPGLANGKQRTSAWGIESQASPSTGRHFPRYLRLGVTPNRISDLLETRMPRAPNMTVEFPTTVPSRSAACQMLHKLAALAEPGAFRGLARVSMCMLV